MRLEPLCESQRALRLLVDPERERLEALQERVRRERRQGGAHLPHLSALEAESVRAVRCEEVSEEGRTVSSFILAAKAARPNCCALGVRASV